jgi:bifunctional NMN adenylyltransferase/nudix hydrolase
MKKYDVIVFIGRFQPFHNAHLEIIKRATELAEHTAIIVGSANQPRTFKNPFSYDEREYLINETLMMVNASYSIHPIQDTIYNDAAWATKVQSIVNKINPFENTRVGIIGYKKDETSFYLDMFPQWDLIEVPLIEELSASQIRKLYFKEDYNPNFIKSVIPVEVLEFLNRFSKTEDYNQILREIKVIEDYKIPYVGLPYPPIFVTVDAVLVQSGHILMIRRRAEPGRGLLALPGGFLDALIDKSLEDAMIREVREETQLKVPAPVLRGSIVEAKVFDAIERSTRGRTITHAFHIKLPNGELPKVKGGSDATSAKWIPISKITPNECFEDHYEIINYFTGV